MASVQSLGIHQPFALPYLVHESLLPVSPRPSLYSWTVHPSHDATGKQVGEDEILQTKKCVVWSRAGVVRRVFNLEIEKEDISQSFITRFASANDLDHPPVRISDSLKADREKSSDQNSSLDALVVVLKTKVHIHFLTGLTQIVSIPFEVKRAFPTPQGCLFQRRISRSTVSEGLKAPPSSLNSSMLSSSFPTSSQAILHGEPGSRPSLTLSKPLEGLRTAKTRAGTYVPPVFSLTDPQAELGVAVATIRSNVRAAYRTAEHPFDPAEEVIYISPKDELASLAVGDVEPLLLAVTHNVDAHTLSIWQARYLERKLPDVPTKHGPLLHEKRNNRRRSSMKYGMSGSATPIGRVPGEGRESTGAQLGRSFSERQPSLEIDNPPPTDMESFVTELEPVFEKAGVQTRSSRRVSSMMARTDLAMGTDRGPPAALHSGAIGRKSLGRVGSRGESMGDARDRTSFGNRTRRSFPGAASFTSDGPLLPQASVDHVLEGLNAGTGFEGFDSMALDDAMNDLPAEIAFSKIHAIPYATLSIVGRPVASSLRTFVMASPSLRRAQGDGLAEISICVMNREQNELYVVRIETFLPSSATPRKSLPKSRGSKRKIPVGIGSFHFQKGDNILDACPVHEGSHSRMLVLTKDSSGEKRLLIQAPDTPSVRIDLPSALFVHHPFHVARSGPYQFNFEVGRGRVMKTLQHPAVSLEPSMLSGQLDLVDDEGCRHAVQIQLEPLDPRIDRILRVAEFVLQSRKSNVLRSTWMEAVKWLRSRDLPGSYEWPAMVVAILSLFVPLLSPGQTGRAAKVNQTTSRRTSRKSGGGKYSYQEMMQEENRRNGNIHAWTHNPAWAWTNATIQCKMSPPPKPRRSINASKLETEVVKAGDGDFMIQCVALTREFLQTLPGSRILGSDDHPFSMGKRPDAQRALVGAVLIAIHLMREDEKLDIRSACLDRGSQNLALLLSQCGRWLKWQDWTEKTGCYYNADIPDVDKYSWDDGSITSPDLVPQPFVPPSIFEHIEQATSSAENITFQTLVDLVVDRHTTSFDVIKARSKLLTPRTFALLEYYRQFHAVQDPALRVQRMLPCGIDNHMLSTLPVGISAPFRDAISSCKASPPSNWLEANLELVGRGDLKPPRAQVASSAGGSERRGQLIGTHEALKDYHGIGNSVFDTEPSHSWDIQSEADRQGVTRLIFADDRRYQDASGLVNQLRAPIVECHPEPDWTEADLLDAQREVVQLATMRTLTVSSGRGMMNYSSRVPLLTEKVPIPGFSLQCLVRPSNVTFNADRALFTEERAVWAFFHNGTAAGLTISRDAEGLDTSWVLFNKPPELTNRHAGFLLALGLNGHLKSLAKWVAFKYLTPKHTMTSVGLLLGLSASYIGTMDTLITRLLSVHVTRMLPPGAAELNLSPLTQTTGIMGIGLLYCSSQHRRMSEVMLSEIENSETEDPLSPEQNFRDESYRLAAGFALGLINLGQGKQLHALHDMNVLERLLSVVISTKNVNLVHILDRATSGATIAFALIYMKTNDESYARKIDIPDTLHQFDYVRPDIFLIRTVARHLIMWDSMRPDHDFISASLPKAYRHRASLRKTRHLSSEDLPFFNVLAGLMLALSLRFAGSGYHAVRDLLTTYLDQFIRLARLPALNYDSKLTRNAVRNCQDVVALALAAVMAGTGDIVVFRRLRSLHGRVDADTPYGSHLAAHMAIGILFLGGGTYTLGTSNLAVASLLCAFYPLFPTNVTDNQAHLQAFRHLWVLAAEPRCVVARDSETHRPLNIPIIITLLDPASPAIHITSPSLVPDLATIRSIRTDSPHHWNTTISFSTASSREPYTHRPINVLLQRRPAYDAPRTSILVSELQVRADHRPVPSVALSATATTIGAAAQDPLEWLWRISVLHGLDASERDLVLPRVGELIAEQMTAAGGVVGGSVVDTRLELETAVLPTGRDRDGGLVNRDGLWQLRLLFSWIDALEKQELVAKEQRAKDAGGKEKGKSGNRGGGAVTGEWLRREVVEKLRWRVWKMGAQMALEG